MDINKIEKDFATFIYELETEDRLVRVGLKDKLESAKIYAKYIDLFTITNLEKFKKLADSTKSKKDKEIYERFYFAIAASFIGNKTAPTDDIIKTYFSNASAKFSGENIAYYQIAPKISKENSYDKREQLDAIACKIVTKVNPKMAKLLEEEVGLLKKLGFEGYIDYFSKSKNITYGDFSKIVQRLLLSTDKIWVKTIGKVSKEVLKRPFANIRSCHISYLRSMSMFDDFYAKDKVVSTFKRFVADIGLNDLLMHIKIDDTEREKKNPRAVCYWPDPPKEVHLVIKPIGGEQDFEAVFHEGGHALHGASVEEDLPFAFRLLSRSNALTEAYAFVLEDLVFDPAWLTTYLNVSSYSGQKIQSHAYFVNLMMLRRYLGKFSYEYQLFSGKTITNGPALYSKNMLAATGFVARDENWLVDMDSGFYSADYLRAWIGSAQIKDYLKRKFGEKWFVNKKAGKFLRDLYASGVAYELEEVVSKLGYKPFDVSLLVEGYQGLLA